MLIKLYRVADATWYDISDYVVDANDFVIYARNEDWTPVIPTSTVDVSFLAPETISINDKIQLYIDATHYYNYIIRDIQLDYPKRTYQLSIEKHYGVLADKKLNRTNLHSYLSNTADTASYWESAVDLGGYRQRYAHANVLWAMKSMFESCGLTLDITDAKTQYLGTATQNRYEVEQGVTDVYGYSLKIDEVMLYLQGFNYAGSDLGFVADNVWHEILDDDEQRDTMWDFVSETCMHLGLMIYNNQGDDYVLVPKTSLTDYVPSDDILIDKKQKKYYRKDVGTFYLANSTNREKYHSQVYNNLDTPVAQQENYGGIRKGTIHSMPNNYRFLVSNPISNAIIPPWQGGTNSLYWEMYNVPNNGYGINMDNLGDYNTKDHTKYTYTVEMLSTIPAYNILSMSINIKDRTSEVETLIFD